MSGERRWVPIPVDDPEVTHLEVNEWYGGVGFGHHLERGYDMPVPPDDQLARKIDDLTRYAMSRVAEYAVVDLPVPEWLAELSDNAQDVRAAFHLDEDES